MNAAIRWTKNRMPKMPGGPGLELMSHAAISRVRGFHQSFPQYHPTPLVSLGCLAQSTGVGGIYIKDESKRFGLNSFKVLGGSYAMASFIARHTGRGLAQLGYAQLTSPELKAQLGDFTFFTATDGNHGRGVAWAAREIGQRCVVYMPKGSSKARYDNIAREGAEVTITDLNYDDAVRLAYAESLKHPNAVALQDTAWPGYEDIPNWIMQGYGTVALEAREQLDAAGVGRPSHLIVQAGVGAFAGSFAGYFANYYADNPPIIIVVEPDAADCHYRSALRGDGTTEVVTGEMTSIMAGLACGEVNPGSWGILRNSAALFVSMPDYVTANGMRTLGAPLPGDERVISGESGAAGFGLLMELLTRPSCADLRTAAGLGPTSTVLMVSTEGNTDPQQYRRIVWGGEYPAPPE